MRGFEIFFESIKSQLKQKNDLVVALVHFMLINEHDFICVGWGEDFPENESLSSSELLPVGWNDHSVYTIRYVSRKQGEKTNLLLKCLNAANLFIVTLVPMNASNNVPSVSLNPATYITDNLHDTKSKAFVTADEVALEQLLNKEVFNKLCDKKDEKADKLKDTGVPSRPVVNPQNPYGNPPNPYGNPPNPYGNPPNPYGNPPNPYGNPPNPFFPAPIGRDDIDPLGRRFPGGGMVFDPFRDGRLRPNPNPNLPPGSVPPGARFDPIGPPGTGRFPGPDPDHERPPPGSDDMFM